MLDVLITEEQIHERVAALGRQIEADYQGKNLTIVAVLTGSLILLADLIRQVGLPLRVALLQASSYKGATTSRSTLLINETFSPDVAGRDVLLLDDILDTGHTLSTLVEHMKERGRGASAPPSSSASSAVRRSRSSRITAASPSPTPSSSATDSTSTTITGTCPTWACSTPRRRPKSERPRRGLPAS